MSQIVKTFIQKIDNQFKTGHAREHSYRPALKELFEKVTNLNVVNEPKRSEYGAPDFIFLKETISKEKIAIAYAEAKDIDVNLNEIEKGEQMERYYGYSNIILTNGLEFRFYKNISSYCEPIIIGKIKNGSIEEFNDYFQLLEDTISDFIKKSKEPIKSGIVLAKIMAGKARRIRDNIKRFLEIENDPRNQNLLDIFDIIKKLLLTDLDKEKFADMYAQTVVYGLFVARYYDKTLNNFSRQEARDLIPLSNPFLRHFFDHIAGSSFDPRIEFIVNELCEEFTYADIGAIIHDYYKIEKDNSRDPIIHFYEDFLQEYDPQERKKMGVFYTPLPVVRFIVRAVDDILKKDFNLPLGLADSSKIDIKRISQGKKYKDSVHRVQILDPAIGTGTFLNEVVLFIKQYFKGQEGRWSSYVDNDLLPRLHGFELMMASYTIAHLKLSSTFLESGAKIENNRLGVYLTNSLEKAEIEEQSLFTGLGLGKAIAQESIEAGKIKNELPVMVVIGNPPYSGVSSNNNKYANSLVDKYKFEPGGKQKLQERNSKWLNDDYVKFIAFSEDLIEKNNEGILAFITNHSYLDNPTFRGMRWKLSQTFNEIYIIDLHGNSKKKEKHPNGTKDENIFNIQQGVSIIVAIKNKNSSNRKDAKVFVADLYGKKNIKFGILNKNEIKYKNIKLDPKQYYFVNKNIKGKDDYDKGFLINEIFRVSNVGIVTSADGVLIASSKENLLNQINKSKEQNSQKKVIKKLKNEIVDEDKIKKVSYRPFDERYIYYDPKIIERARFDVMKNFLNKDNLGFITNRQVKTGSWNHVFISKNIAESSFISNKTSEIGTCCPLYLYSSDNKKTSNLNKEIVLEIEKVVGKTKPEDIFDYIYAVLHSPKYRKKYSEFLKVDFPRVLYPQNKNSFWQLIKLGKELRDLHLLESLKINEFITTFPISGSNIIENKYLKYKDKKVYINENQYFGDVLEVAWNSYIGGYQPAQKWLKDRKGQSLSNLDIEHYQKMIIILIETTRIMGEIDKIFNIK